MTHQCRMDYFMNISWKALGILKKVESTRSANYCNDLIFL